MTWRELYLYLDGLCNETLTRAAPQITGGLLNTVGSLVKSKSAVHPAEPGGLVDEVCKAFAGDGVWPRGMDESTLIQIVARLESARTLAEFVSCPTKPEPKCLPLPNHAHREEMLRWLLTDYWHYAGSWRAIYKSDVNNDPAD